jgi:pimeloyl-ACP methyl ester carboxylesterase
LLDGSSGDAASSATELDSGELDTLLDSGGIDALRDSGGDDAASRAQDGEVEGSSQLPAPVADVPCGTDLSFAAGKVTPSLGTITGEVSGRDPAALGPYKVLERPVTIPIDDSKLNAAGYEIAVAAGELSGTLYAPSQDGSTIATDRRFPLLLGAAGFQATYPDYKGFWTHFASHGIAVLGVTTRGSSSEALHDKEALETSLAARWATERSDFRDAIDADKLALAGHSKGGKVAFFAAAIDPRVDLVFGWDPSNAGGPPCGVAELIGAECQAKPVAPNCGALTAKIPKPEGVLQYMHAESFVFGVPPDSLFNPDADHNALNFYRGAPSPASLVYFDGGHAAWIDSGLAGVFGNADIIRITKTVQTAKLLTVFYGARDLSMYLPGGAYLTSVPVRKVETK